MIINFKNINVNTYRTKENILNKISEYGIFKRYCTNFKEIGKGFTSELRKDNNPDVFIYSKNNKLNYIDFAANLNLDCFEYVMLKYNISFYECLNFIYNDLKLEQIVYNHNFKNQESKIKKIIIEERNFNIVDFNFWNNFGISLETIYKYNVKACNNYRFINDKYDFTINYNKYDLIYAYEYIVDNTKFYKIYRPFNKQKFLFNGDTLKMIEGYDQLDKESKILIITKSLKDVMCYRELGYNAISLQGEYNRLDDVIFEELKTRFKYILLNYDNDLTGKNKTEGYYNKNNIWINGFSKTYNIPYFYIDKTKDISDYISIYGKEKASKLIKSKIKKTINDNSYTR